MLSSDEQYLAVAPFEGATIQLWRVADLGTGATPVRLGGPGQFNLPKKCVVSRGALFVADTSFNRVHVWQRETDALAGKPADALLGVQDERNTRPEIGRDKLFMQGALAFDGNYLWVGEFKFSIRILRFFGAVSRSNHLGCNLKTIQYPPWPSSRMEGSQTIFQFGFCSIRLPASSRHALDPSVETPLMMRPLLQK